MVKQKRISSLAFLKHWLNLNVLQLPQLLFPIQHKSGAGQQTGKSHAGREVIGYPTLTALALKLSDTIQSELSL